MTHVRVFDPAMCCSTGICGPSVDPQLVRFAADLAWLEGQGVKVERFNLSQEPAKFAEDAAVKGALEAKGEGALPLVQVNGEVRSTGLYPDRAELARWAGVQPPAPSLYTEAVAALVSMGAAIAGNCEASFRKHLAKARELGVAEDDLARAVASAEAVKKSGACATTSLAKRHLDPKEPVAGAPPDAGAGSDGASKSSCC